MYYLHPEEVLKHNKNFKETVVSPAYYKTKVEMLSSIKICKKCDNSKNIFIKDKRFTCAATNRTYFVKGSLCCRSSKAVY